MDQVKVFLRTPLFTVNPRKASAAILDGRVREQTSGGFIIEVSGYADQSGDPLDLPARTLFVPTSKIDHMTLEDA